MQTDGSVSKWANEIEAILFDLDGTLIDTDDQVAKLLARFISPLACFLPVVPDTMARRLLMRAETPGNRLMALLDGLGWDDNVFAIGDTLRRWRGLHPRPNLPLIDGASDILNTLSAHYRLGIVTTRGRRDAEAFLIQHSLTALFDVVVTRECTSRLKPHPAPVQMAAKTLGVPPHSCLMVGDTVPDVLSARAAGTWIVAALSGFGEQRELEWAGAHAVIQSVAHLGEILPLDNLP
jgi:phosphoglycolate phosphatase-like HAD superfamily hydrolase